MKKIIFSLLLASNALFVSAQSMLSFGLRGGLDFMLPKAEGSVKNTIGAAGTFDIGYTYYWQTRYSGEWGIHTGASIGYASDIAKIDFEQQYTNYDYLNNEIRYTTTGVVDVSLKRMYIEVPVMAAFRYNGFVLQAGLKAQCAPMSKSSQELQQHSIDAFYVPYNVHVTDELITGVLAQGDLHKEYANGAPVMSLILAMRIGYEMGVGDSGRLGIMAFLDYNAWNTSHSNTAQPMIAVSSITDPVNPVPDVTVNNVLSSVITRINPLQVGISIYYALVFEKY